ncbi:MAG: hypothetical protein HZA58_05305 [Acidimicrobiia bacterium]|nr:hypothetical protein [Acidimicrobiia bacterium]
MPAAPFVIALLVAAACVAGIVTLALAPAPLAGSSAMLFTAGMALATLIVVAGLLLARGRWARYLGMVLGATWIAVGALVESGAGYGLIALGAAALASTAGPWLGRWLRHLARADGAPPAAVVALLTLVLTPAASAIAAPSGIHGATWGFSAWSVVLALALARIIPGSLSAARIAHPIAAAVTALFVGLPEGAAAAVSGVVVALMSWRRDVSLAVVPIVAIGSPAHRIPPELAPIEVLAAAGADATGRRKP